MLSRSCLFLGVLLCLFVLIPPTAQSDQYMGREIRTATWRGQDVEYVDAEILFMIKNGQDPIEIKTYLASNNLQLARDLDRFGFGKISLPRGKNIFPVIEAMEETGLFLFAEPNMINRPYTDPDDRQYVLGNQWGLDNPGSIPGSMYDADVDAPEAWGLTTGSSEVLVSVLDSGIPMVFGVLSHPDLDDPARFILGQDFIGDGEGVRDRYGHGTHVIGILSAETNNALGIAGVSWNSRILVNQVFSAQGLGSDDAFRDGMIYSVDYGARIVNYSGGGAHSGTKEHGVAYADSHGVLLVAAAGKEKPDSVGYPAAYCTTYANVVSVAATNISDHVAPFSGQGSAVCVAAPGGISEDSPYGESDIYSTMPNYHVTLNNIGICENYGYYAGTSMAAPIVSGIAALLLSVDTTLTPAEIRDILEQTADEVGPYTYDPETGKCLELGHGRVNAYEAVRELLPPLPQTVSLRFEYPPHWYHPPIKVGPGQDETILLKLYNIGDQNLVWSVTSGHVCIQVTSQGQLAPRDSILIPITLDGTGVCNDTLIDVDVILSTNEDGGKLYFLRVQAVVADDYYECPRDQQTVETLNNGVLKLYVGACGDEQIRDMTTFFPGEDRPVFFKGGTIVATTSDNDTLVGRLMPEDWYAGAREKLYTDECDVDFEPDFWIVYTKDIFIHDLEPPADDKWWLWEVSQQIKFFKEAAPDVYKHMVIKYVRVKRHDPPNWWPDQSTFTDYEDTYVGVAEDIDCPWSSSSFRANIAGYDGINHVAWQKGYDHSRLNPEYNNYYCGIALADGGMSGESIIPYGSYCVKSNQYLYPQDGWGWNNSELYQLASTAGNSIQDQDSAVDRAYVFTARKIDAGTDPNAETAFTVLKVVAPDGLGQLQEYVDSARAIVNRESWIGHGGLGGLPAICGDVNGDKIVNVGDVVYLSGYLYRGGPPPMCPSNRGDCNNDGIIDVGDVTYLVAFLYRGGPEPVCPGIWY